MPGAVPGQEVDAAAAHVSGELHVVKVVADGEGARRIGVHQYSQFLYSGFTSFMSS